MIIRRGIVERRAVILDIVASNSKTYSTNILQKGNLSSLDCLKQINFLLRKGLLYVEDSRLNTKAGKMKLYSITDKGLRILESIRLILGAK